MIKPSMKRRFLDPSKSVRPLPRSGTGRAEGPRALPEDPADLLPGPGIAAILAARADGLLLEEVARRLLIFASFLQANASPHLARRLTDRATELVEAAATRTRLC